MEVNKIAPVYQSYDIRIIKIFHKCINTNTLNQICPSELIDFFNIAHYDFAVAKLKYI